MSAPTSEPLRVSAYIPCYNNAKTVEQAIAGIQRQTIPVDEIFVVDDGSTDDSAAVVERLGVRVLRMETNQGRGAVRARAMETARNEFVLCCDATMELAANFLEIALAWFSNKEIIGAYGRCRDRHARSTLDRWRARHLFKQNISFKVAHFHHLSTYGAIVRKSSVRAAGNYNPLLRHGEDFDLGSRLQPIGDVVFDPKLEVQPVVHNTLFQLMERYSRWNRAAIQTYTISDFIESHVVTWKILIPRDLKDGDWSSALISAMVPYFSAAYADKRSLSFSPRPAAEPTASLQGKP
jgi:glycosyltransferase involved in cell wall biosynthesis